MIQEYTHDQDFFFSFFTFYVRKESLHIYSRIELTNSRRKSNALTAQASSFIDVSDIFCTFASLVLNSSKFKIIVFLFNKPLQN